MAADSGLEMVWNPSGKRMAFCLAEWGLSCPVSLAKARAFAKAIDLPPLHPPGLELAVEGPAIEAEHLCSTRLVSSDE